ncbi:aldo/keto reductase [Mariniblastus fucicola]|uniref:2,5-diketo-D-gluconic acid reductase A n=1 Tax=Mariniblastus fucicola TaxID=980251 RepID=A0A5B9PNC5_9BACT|nr:aldo/keto reductase [Mariniblastus fucicola]QEG23763.1 2,5-diketo-D-gluconic acid reductase A [Mariniblastus fucicola]
MSKTTLGNSQMPLVGLGNWKIEKDVAADVVQKAIEIGYRHFDCACDYGNESEVGDGLHAAISNGSVQREDLWITSKLWNSYHAAEHVRPAIEKTLADLKQDYLDLYLIHFPIATKFVPFEERYPPEWFFDPDAAEPKLEPVNVPIRETWEAMEELKRSGLVKNIGVCNFGCSLIRDLLSYASIRPAFLQVELHPMLTQEKLLRYCRQESIEVTAFSPLGGESYYSLGIADRSESTLENPIVKDIAAAYSKTPAQVHLRWGIQRGTAVVPKTSQPERLVENLDVFDFELSDEEMKQIASLNQNRRFNDPGDFCESAFNTFFPIYE